MLTAVDFHFNVADRLGYACRLLRKATRIGQGVAVTAAPSTLGALDALLWRFDPTDFVAHVRLSPAGATRLTERMAPVWLVDDAACGAGKPVLLNLGDDPPAGYEGYSRLIEIVGVDPEERRLARARWKHYAARGHPIDRHEAA